jgi:hypothetical protein
MDVLSSWILAGLMSLVGFFEASLTSKNISWLRKKRHNPLIDIFVGRPIDPWHGAPQQSTLPFRRALQFMQKFPA